MTGSSAYREFTGKSVEEALKIAREEFGVGLDELDFEILTPGSRGVLGMGAEPARIVAAPRSALGGAAPKREAAAQVPLPAPAHEERFGDRDRGPDRERGPRTYDRGREGGRPPMRDQGQRFGGGQGRYDRGPSQGGPGGPGRQDRDRAPERGHRPGDHGHGGRPEQARRGPQSGLTPKELAEVAAARVAPPAERVESAVVTPEAMAAAKEILEQLMEKLDFDVKVEVEAGETNRLNVVGEADEKEALGALIGRKGERLSALQHLLNLLLSKRVGEWTRVLVDVEDYRGRRERQLRELANRAAQRVIETGKMLQLEPMPALERRWIHLALREHAQVATQSIGEEPNRRVVVLPREV
jgi:spoIIIJ-associated protein